MARKLYYKIFDNGKNKLSDDEWEEIDRLQHWYNTEFVWTAGKLGLKRFVVFPSTGHVVQENDEIWEHIMARRRTLKAVGSSESEIIAQLASEGLIVVKKGGYFDDCLASGFTRVAGNEFNAYLVCDFLLKASRIAASAAISVIDEGEFIKTGEVQLLKGRALFPAGSSRPKSFYLAIAEHRHLFSVVDPAKYDNYPFYQSVVADFGRLTKSEKLAVVRDRSWLGFENNFDFNGDDVVGFDLNRKVSAIEIDEGESDS